MNKQGLINRGSTLSRLGRNQPDIRYCSPFGGPLFGWNSLDYVGLIISYGCQINKYMVAAFTGPLLYHSPTLSHCLSAGIQHWCFRNALPSNDFHLVLRPLDKMIKQKTHKKKKKQVVMDSL